MKQETKLIPYISLIPFTNVIHILSDRVLVATLAVIIVGVIIALYEAVANRKGRQETKAVPPAITAPRPSPPPPPPNHTCQVRGRYVTNPLLFMNTSNSLEGLCIRLYSLAPIYQSPIVAPI